MKHTVYLFAAVALLSFSCGKQPEPAGQAPATAKAPAAPPNLDSMLASMSAEQVEELMKKLEARQEKKATAPSDIDGIVATMNEEQVAELIRKLEARNAKPAEGEQKPAEGEQKPAEGEQKPTEAVAGSADASQTAPTVEEAGAWVSTTEKEWLKLVTQSERANWIMSTYITHDTEGLAADADAALMEYVGRKVKEATRFDGLPLSDALKRKLLVLKVAMPLASPSDEAKREELTSIKSGMESTYGKGKYCPERLGGKCLTLDEMSEIMATSRNADELLDLWVGWHKVSVPMRANYARFVELGNEGARELGFSNLGDLWKSAYDMSPDEFQAETDRLYEQLKPLYQDLHCYVRARLGEVYGTDKVPQTGPIPAHLLGNMWAQEWGYLYDVVKPEAGDAVVDLGANMKAKGIDERGMARIAENFFVSVGLPALPETFWERSMFTRPQDRDVVCHASAWDLDWVDDLRIKMCIRINEEDLTTIHHELGHNYYQRAYNALDPLFRNSANDGFHEALGDTLSLSVTPGYLVQIGLLDKEPADNLNPLMARALEKIAFLPFGLLIDRWRWDVFAGVTPPEKYNEAWWALRLKYQGVAPGVERTEADFDPGAKYHIPANVPYTRYFLAAILQFQFHRALCRQMGHTGPLHTCSIYNNKEAGARIDAMMKMGLSRPWPEALEAMTGERQMDATAILDYFKPLHDWLKEQNKDRQCGW